MNPITLLNSINSDNNGWIVAQLFRRHYINPATPNLPQTYTMICAPQDSIGQDYIAYVAHVENGEQTRLPDFSRGEVEYKPDGMKMTRGVLRTYGYKPGRLVFYHPVTHSIREVE